MHNTRLRGCDSFHAVSRFALAFLLVTACKSAPPVPAPGPLPPGASFTGKWESSFGPLHLDQRDAWTFGTYGAHGALFGEAEGNRLRFNWKDHTLDRWGRGYFVISADGTRLEGRYGPEKDEVESGPCWAHRPGAAPPAPPTLGSKP